MESRKIVSRKFRLTSIVMIVFTIFFSGLCAYIGARANYSDALYWHNWKPDEQEGLTVEQRKLAMPVSKHQYLGNVSEIKYVFLGLIYFIIFFIPSVLLIMGISWVCGNGFKVHFSVKMSEEERPSGSI